MTRCYTGVGSRETPSNVQAEEIQLAYALAASGWTVRSGHAQGSDLAFERGAEAWAAHSGVESPSQIFLPWKGFNGSHSPFFTPSKEAFTIAASIHPRWSKLNREAQALHARNAHQVLGENLDSPSDFLICWTEDGRVEGGTRTAILLAQREGVPIYNLGLTGSKAIRPRVQNGQLEVWQSSSASWILAPVRLA